jgi:hypothetical protein
MRRAVATRGHLQDPDYSQYLDRPGSLISACSPSGLVNLEFVAQGKLQTVTLCDRSGACLVYEVQDETGLVKSGGAANGTVIVTPENAAQPTSVLTLNYNVCG